MWVLTLGHTLPFPVIAPLVSTGVRARRRPAVLPAHGAGAARIGGDVRGRPVLHRAAVAHPAGVVRRVDAPVPAVRGAAAARHAAVPAADPGRRGHGADPAERARVRAAPAAASHPSHRHAHTRPARRPLVRVDRRRGAHDGARRGRLAAGRLGGDRAGDRRTPTPSWSGGAPTSAIRSSSRSRRGSRAPSGGCARAGLPEGVAWWTRRRRSSSCWWPGSPSSCFTPWVRRLGVDLRFWMLSYALYLLAVFFPQSSTFRLLVPLAPALGALAIPRSPGVPGEPRGARDRRSGRLAVHRLVGRRARLDAAVIGPARPPNRLHRDALVFPCSF